MLVVVEGVAFPSLGSEADSQVAGNKLVTKARKKREKLLAGIEQAQTSTAVKNAQHAYVGSSDVRFAAMISEAKKLPFNERQDVLTYKLMASQLDITKPIDEKVYLRIKKKASGGFRAYCDYGIKHRTAQKIARDMLRPQLHPADFQYDVPGRGVPAAIKAARELINAGYSRGRHLDIKSFFDKISHKYIHSPALRLEPGIKSAVLTGEHVSIVKGAGNIPEDIFLAYSSEIASAGTPQGSATSPLVASMLLSKLDLGGLPDGVEVLNYVDDFLLLAKEDADLEASSDALQAALTALSAGELILAPKNQGSATEFVYLGHQFTVAKDGKPKITVHSASLHAFHTKAAGQAEALVNEAKHVAKFSKQPLTSPAHHATFIKLLGEFVGWIKAWLLAFSEADDIAELTTEFFSYAIAVCDDIGLPNAEEVWTTTKPSRPLTYDEIAGLSKG